MKATPMRWFTLRKTPAQLAQEAADHAEDLAIRAAEDAEEKADADYISQFTVADNGADFTSCGSLIGKTNAGGHFTTARLRISPAGAWSWSLEISAWASPTKYRASSDRTFGYHTQAAYDLRDALAAHGCHIAFSPKSELTTTLRVLGYVDEPTPIPNEDD